MLSEKGPEFMLVMLVRSILAALPIVILAVGLEDFK